MDLLPLHIQSLRLWVGQCQLKQPTKMKKQDLVLAKKALAARQVKTEHKVGGIYPVLDVCD
jgi:hypothetical protein